MGATRGSGSCHADFGCGPTRATWRSPVYGDRRLCVIHGSAAEEAGLNIAWDDEAPSVYRTPLPLHRTEANHGVRCSTCDGGGCLDCTDPA